jgi:hypothetical protein
MPGGAALARTTEIKRTEREERMSDEGRKYRGDEKVIKRNVERSREVIDARKQRIGDTDIPESIVPDVSTGPEDSYPGQWDVPSGGVSSSSSTGGSAKRRKAR